MNFYSVRRFAVLAACLVLTGCSGNSCKGDMGPKGDTGGQGPGLPTAVNVYSQTFDGASYSPTEWTCLLQGGGSGLVAATDATRFVSAGKSLKITASGGAGVGSIVYTPVSYVGGDYYAEYFVDLTGFTIAGEKMEFIFGYSGQIRADFGYLVGSPGSFYSYNSSQVSLVSNPSNTYFHHIVMCWHPSTGLSDYWLDGVLVGQGLNAVQSLTFTGAPTAYTAMYMPLSMNSADYFRVDNVSVYHY